MTDPFQANASRQGRLYEAWALYSLQQQGWHIRTVGWCEPTTRIQVDLVAEQEGVEHWIECKGSWLSTGQRDGSRRTDTVKKVIANAALLAQVEGARPFVLVTSHLPVAESAGARWLDLAQDAGWITYIIWLPMTALPSP
jgi:Holliday junction resolvase-like predicted endonuclease